MGNRLKTVVYVFLIIAFSYSVFRTIASIREKGRRSRELQEETAMLEKENAKLEKEIAYKRSDEYIQKEAKERLFMGLSGEKIILIPKEMLEEIRKEAYGGDGEVAGIQDARVPFWKKWLEVLGIELH